MSDVAKPPAAPGVPLLGNGLAFSRDPFRALGEWASHGDVVRLEFPGRTQYMVTHPDLVEAVLVGEQDSYRISRRQRETFRNIEADAVTATTGDRWARQRRALQPAFTWENVRSYGDRMAVATADHVSGWRDGQRIDLLDEMRTLTLHILAGTVLGVDVEGEEAVVREAADALVEWADFRRPGHLLPDWIPTPADRRFQRAVGALDVYVENALAEGAGDDETVAAVLQAAESRGEVSHAEVHDNLTGLLLAGHDSTAVTLTYAWLEVSRHPSVLADVSEEVAAVTGDGDLPGAGDFDALEQTRRVIRETLRLYPPTWAVAREATEPVTLGGYRLPAGAQVMLPQWVCHRDGRFWDEPDTFDPERWAGDDTDRPTYAYFPFSGGPRHCIGMRFARLELVLALATMVDRIDLDVRADGDLSFRPSLSLRPEVDIRATVQRL